MMSRPEVHKHSLSLSCWVYISSLHHKEVCRRIWLVLQYAFDSLGRVNLHLHLHLGKLSCKAIHHLTIMATHTPLLGIGWGHMSSWGQLFGKKHITMNVKYGDSGMEWIPLSHYTDVLLGRLDLSASLPGLWNPPVQWGIDNSLNVLWRYFIS